MSIDRDDCDERGRAEVGPAAVYREPEPKRLTFLNPSNSKRRKAKYERNYGVQGRRGEAVRAMGCICAGTVHRRSCRGEIVAAHVTARGMGGVKGGARDLVGMCEGHHAAAGEARTPERRAFEKWTGIDLAAEAERIAKLLDEMVGEEPCYLCKQVGGHAPLCRTVEARKEHAK